MNSEDNKMELGTPSKELLSKYPCSSSNYELQRGKLTHLTPPSRYGRFRNPFESHLMEKLHTNFFSPSVFKPVQVEEKFQWTIDEISHMKPVDIDENAEQNDHDHDSVIELSAQAKIDVFFSREVVPSPFDRNSRPAPLINVFNTPGRYSVKRTRNAETQTALSLPIDLPPKLEAALKPYFYQSVEENDKKKKTNEFDTSLYRKLFVIEEGNVIDDDDGDKSKSQSDSLIKNFSPDLPSMKNFDLNSEKNSSFNLDECNLSPIISEKSKFAQGKKVRTRLLNVYHMSVDESSNSVPDVCRSIFKEDKTEISVNNSLKDISDSSVVWDLEYNQIVSTPKKVFQVDVSNLNTPKSKIFLSNRKNLSNSFNIEEKPTNSLKSFDINDRMDTGYQTEIIEDQSSIYASTPSKRLVL